MSIHAKTILQNSYHESLEISFMIDWKSNSLKRWLAKFSTCISLNSILYDESQYRFIRSQTVTIIQFYFKSEEAQMAGSNEGTNYTNMNR